MIANSIKKEKYVDERYKTIQFLTELKFPALPVALRQDPYKYPKKAQNGKVEYEVDGKTPIS